MHEARTRNFLADVLLEPPDLVRRQIRTYLSRQVDLRRMKRPDEKIPQLTTVQAGLNELKCPAAEFLSGARLEFDIQLEEQQGNWRVKRFRFHLFLPQKRKVDMVRVHLNADEWHAPLVVPRCHMHVGSSNAHIPFPVMDPRLIVHLFCEQVEPDFGA